MPPSYALYWHESLSFQAAIEWEASGFRYMPTPEEVANQNISWRTQVANAYEHLKWVEQQLVGTSASPKTDD